MRNWNSRVKGRFSPEKNQYLENIGIHSVLFLGNWIAFVLGVSSWWKFSWATFSFGFQKAPPWNPGWFTQKSWSLPKASLAASCFSRQIPGIKKKTHVVNWSYGLFFCKCTWLLSLKTIKQLWLLTEKNTMFGEDHIWSYCKICFFPAPRRFTCLSIYFQQKAWGES